MAIAGSLAGSTCRLCRGCPRPRCCLSVTGSGSVLAVTFTITNSGTPLLSNIKGFAVQEGGTWKVAAATFCVLLKLEGSPPAACSDSSITALPQ